MWCRILHKISRCSNYGLLRAKRNSFHVNHALASNSYSGFANKFPTSCWKCKDQYSRNRKLFILPLETNYNVYRNESNDDGIKYEYQDPVSEDDIVKVIFVDPEGIETTIKGKVGDNVLQLALRYEISCEGACEGQLACTSCHVYVDDDFVDLTGDPDSIEEDLLDNAPFLKPNSRLACQLTLSKEWDGIRFTLPHATINFYVDGHKPKPH